MDIRMGIEETKKEMSSGDTSERGRGGRNVVQYNL